MVKPSVVPFGVSNERWRITFHSELKFWSAASHGSKLTDRLPAIFLGREPAALRSQLDLGEHWRAATVPMDRVLAAILRASALQVLNESAVVVSMKRGSVRAAISRASFRRSLILP